MKMKYWLILAATLSAGFAAESAWADDQPGPAPGSTNLSATPAPEKPGKKKKTAVTKKIPAPPKKWTAAAEPAKPVPLVKGPAVVNEKNPSSVNVRAQAALNSEVITRLKKGERVNVLEIVEKKAKENEVSKWAKVSLPTNA